MANLISQVWDRRTAQAPMLGRSAAGWPLHINTPTIGPWQASASPVFDQMPLQSQGKLMSSVYAEDSAIKRFMSPTSFKKPGLLMAAIGAGTAGAVMGNGDVGSFATGAVAGIAGGSLLQAGATAAYRGLGSYAEKNAGKMAANTMKAISVGRMMTSASSRSLLFAGGALLAGGLFSSMFANNRNSYKSGLNANRGNSIVR